MIHREQRKYLFFQKNNREQRIFNLIFTKTKKNIGSQQFIYIETLCSPRTKRVQSPDLEMGKVNYDPEKDERKTISKDAKPLTPEEKEKIRRRRDERA